MRAERAEDTSRIEAPTNPAQRHVERRRGGQPGGETISAGGLVGDHAEVTWTDRAATTLLRRAAAAACAPRPPCSATLLRPSPPGPVSGVALAGAIAEDNVSVWPPTRGLLRPASARRRTCSTLRWLRPPLWRLTGTLSLPGPNPDP